MNHILLSDADGIDRRYLVVDLGVVELAVPSRNIDRVGPRLTLAYVQD
jgi:hypothetical protein